MSGDGRNAHRPVLDRSDFEALLRPVIPLAFRYAVRLTKGREPGMDLVQEASVLAFRSFHQFSAGTNFKAWFLKILLHRYYRTRKREVGHPTIGLEDAPESFLYIQARRIGLAMKDDPVEVILGKVDSQAISDALERLPDEYREVAMLHFLSEMPYAECAETLEIPVGTVRSRLHRARRLLQVSLWQIANERGYVTDKETV